MATQLEEQNREVSGPGVYGNLHYVVSVKTQADEREIFFTVAEQLTAKRLKEYGEKTRVF